MTVFLSFPSSTLTSSVLKSSIALIFSNSLWCLTTSFQKLILPALSFGTLPKYFSLNKVAISLAIWSSTLTLWLLENRHFYHL